MLSPFFATYFNFQNIVFWMTYAIKWKWIRLCLINVVTNVVMLTCMYTWLYNVEVVNQPLGTVTIEIGCLADAGSIRLSR